jgi:molybdopterin converting factor small subunit
MTDITLGIPVTVRFFAGAAAAAGRDSVVLNLPSGSSILDAIRELSGQSDEMALVIRKCSYLCDGVAVRDRAIVLRPHQTVDVLPPFSGG